jgi:hypothetical protein
MSTRKSWFNWISATDKKQHEWAGRYLRAHGVVTPPAAMKTYETFLTWGCEYFPDTSATRELIKLMRNAWTQKKFRDKRNGKKSFSFVLPTDTKTKLDDLAKQQPDDISATKMLERIIFQDKALQEIHMAEVKRLKEEPKKLKEELQKLKKEHAKEIVTHRHALQDLAKPLVSALMQQCRDSLQSNEESLTSRGALEGQDLELGELFKQRATEIISSANQGARKHVQRHMREAQMAYKRQHIGPAAPDKRDGCFGENNTLEAYSPADEAHLATHEQTQDSHTED